MNRWERSDARWPEDAASVTVKSGVSLVKSGAASLARFSTGAVFELEGLRDASALFHEPEILNQGGVRALASPPTHYLIEIEQGAELLELDDVTCGEYEGAWLDIEAGEQLAIPAFTFDGGVEQLTVADSSARDAIWLYLVRDGL